METGTITELGERNSGLIRRKGKTERLFFHADALIDVTFRELKVGDKLTFRVTESSKGPYATEIRLATR